jgi:hypothetical protein
MTVVMQIGTLLFIWNTIGEKNADSRKVYSFFIIAASICMFSAYGFITAPDVPLLFFTSFFLYYYKKFLIDQKLVNIVLFSLSMAGLVYSKYQAVLVIGFVVLSNFKLLKNYKFWIAGISALALLTPHIMWQITNDFPSFKFHLVERTEGFKWSYLFEYIPNQLAVFNPLVFCAIVYVIAKNKAQDLFTRALYFLIIGFIGFFWITTLRGHVEPQWTMACSVPMIILIYNNSNVNPVMFRFLRKALIPSIVILFIFRILLASNWSVISSFVFGGKKEKFEYMGSIAKDLPVVFPASYSKPALYTFFTGKEAVAINSLYNRKTQYDIWQFEKKYNNKPVFVCGFGEGNSKLYRKDDFEFYGYATDSLQTVNRIEVEIKPVLKTLYTGDSLTLSLILKNPYEYDIDFNHKKFPVQIFMAFLDDKGMHLYPLEPTQPINLLKKGATSSSKIKTLVPDLPSGKYRFGICLQNLLGPAINDSFSKINIIKR